MCRWLVEAALLCRTRCGGARNMFNDDEGRLASPPKDVSTGLLARCCEVAR